MGGLLRFQRIMPRWLRRNVAKVGVICTVVFIWVAIFDVHRADTTATDHHDQQLSGLNVWLDLFQTKELTGLDSPIFLVRNGKSSTFLTRTLAADSSLGVARLVLPPDDDIINISWNAPAKYFYSIEGIFSSQPDIVQKPEFSIDTIGLIPTSDKVFSVFFRCTGRKSGTSSVGFTLRVRSSVENGQDLETPASPLRLQFEKECEEDLPDCVPECHNGGVCNMFQQCDCPDGYYGRDCKQALCDPHCYNGGTCVAPGLCMCPTGYTGDACQSAFCEKDCNQHGHCVGPDKCKCYRSWQGKYCDKPVPSLLRSKSIKETKGSNNEPNISRTQNKTKTKPKR